MIRIGICDDDLAHIDKTAELIHTFLKQGKRKYHINTYTNTIELLMCEELDILFLDIFIGETNGMDMARLFMEEKRKTEIIFTTSSKDFAIEAFEVAAVGYLVKPLEYEKFNYFLEKAVCRVQKKGLKTIAILDKKTPVTIFLKDIVYAENRNRKIDIYMETGEIRTLRSKIKDLMKELDDERFIHPHQSFIVNMDNIRGITKTDFVLYDGSLVPIKQNGYTDIKQKYFEYILKKSTR